MAQEKDKGRLCGDMRIAALNAAPLSPTEQLLLRTLPIELAEEHIAISKAMKNLIARKKDPTGDESLMVRFRALNTNPVYISVSERVADKLFGDNFADINHPRDTTREFN